MLTSFIFIEANYHWNKPIQNHKILSKIKLLIKNKYEKKVSVGQSTVRTTCHENKDKQQTPIVCIIKKMYSLSKQRLSCNQIL